jgi:hypothetical protein
VCSNGKRTSILEYVAISVKKMSIFVVLHRWGTGTLLVLLVDWLGTARHRTRAAIRVERKHQNQRHQPTIHRGGGWTNGRGDGGGKRPEWNHAQWPSMSVNGSGADGRMDGWTDGRATKRTHRGRRKRPKTMAISSSIFCDFVSLFRNFLILLFLI